MLRESNDRPLGAAIIRFSAASLRSAAVFLRYAQKDEPATRNEGLLNLPLRKVKIDTILAFGQDEY